MRRNLSTNSIAAIVLFTYVVLFVAISTIAIPDIDTMESADRFFWTILAGAVGGKVLFLVLLIRNIDYYTYQLGQALVLAFLFVAMLQRTNGYRDFRKRNGYPKAVEPIPNKQWCQRKFLQAT
jgi:hypothetical protein